MPEHASPIEVMFGAVLVQHTTWQSAERALGNLREQELLDFAAVLQARDEALIEAIRVCGTPTVKTRRLRALAETVGGAGGLATMLALPADELRNLLLGTHGIGPETADAIVLYAAGQRAFVVDAYTRRVFGRIGVGPEREGYEDWRAYFLDAMREASVETLQRYHAWIVLHAKAVCRPTPTCADCPLQGICNVGLERKESLAS